MLKMSVQQWWSTIISKGSKFGCYVSEDKSWLIVNKKNLLSEAAQIFSNSDIKFTIEGERNLGAAVGSSDFRMIYAKKEVNNWCEEISKLGEYAKTQPQAAYSEILPW